MRLAGKTWIPDDDEYFRPIFEGGMVFEGKNLETGLRYVTEWDCAVDGGAHVGSWARALADKFAQVYAFEPQPENFSCLMCNIDGLENVICKRAALGDADGLIKLLPGNNSGCWHIAKEGIAAPVVLLDDVESLWHRKLGYFKLDVEGYEPFALRGARRIIHRDRPVIQIEEKALSHSYTGPTGRAVLEGWGYKEVARSGRDVVFVWD